MTAPFLASYFSEGTQDGRYYQHPYTGQRAPSVTTINSMVNKDGLKQWYVDMALKEIIRNPDGFFQRDAKDFFKGYRFAAEKFRDDRGLIGTAVHAIIEAELKEEWVIPEAWDIEVAQLRDQWHLFRQEHEVIPFRVEVTMWNHELPLAGTADLIGWIDGVFGLYDAKSSRKLHLENELQLAMLKNCPEMLTEVPEGTEGAMSFTKEVKQPDGTRQKETRWFLSEYAPEINHAGFIHLRPDDYDPMAEKFVPAFHAFVPAKTQYWDLHWEEAQGYHRAYTAMKLREARERKEAA